MYWYLAGPFFNSQSKKVLNDILVVLEEHGHTAFAPMRDGILCPKDASAEERQKVFDLDIGKIDESEGMVALLDYPLPLYQQLWMQIRTPEGKIDLLDVSFPDSGTLIEMGYAYHRSEHEHGEEFYPIIGYTTSGKGFNLMVAQLCTCFATSLQELKGIMFLIEDQKIEALARIKSIKIKELQEF